MGDNLGKDLNMWDAQMLRFLNRKKLWEWGLWI